MLVNDAIETVANAACVRLDANFVWSELLVVVNNKQFLLFG